MWWLLCAASLAQEATQQAGVSGTQAGAMAAVTAILGAATPVLINYFKRLGAEPGTLTDADGPTRGDILSKLAATEEKLKRAESELKVGKRALADMEARILAAIKAQGTTELVDALHDATSTISQALHKVS